MLAGSQREGNPARCGRRSRRIPASPANQSCGQNVARALTQQDGVTTVSRRGQQSATGRMWKRNHKGNVFVGNLPRDFADERLAEAFDPYGIVLSAHVARDPANGERLRYGFVDIATDRAATAAIAALDGFEIDGCKLNVKKTDKPVKKPTDASAPRRRAPMRRAAPFRDTFHDVPASAEDAGQRHEPMAEAPAERKFEVQVVRRRSPSFQVERRVLPRRV